MSHDRPTMCELEDQLERELRAQELKEKRVTEYILPSITHVEMIDGYGRRYTAEGVTEMSVEVTDEGRALRLTHDGDTSHGLTEEAVWQPR